MSTLSITGNPRKFIILKSRVIHNSNNDTTFLFYMGDKILGHSNHTVITAQSVEYIINSINMRVLSLLFEVRIFIEKDMKDRSCSKEYSSIQNEIASLQVQKTASP